MVTTIDATSYRELAQAAGAGDLVLIYYDRVEGEVGGWRCKSCGDVFADLIPFGPPAGHECETYLCAACDQEAGIQRHGSHGICPRHFVLAFLPVVPSCECSKCDEPLPPGTVVYSAGPFTLCHECASCGAVLSPRITA